jgi:DNA-binding NarL/FixJ family response regulator
LVGSMPDAGPGTAATHDVRGPEVCDDRRVRATVLIVDDHADFRVSARSLLEAEGFTVVGEAAGGHEALAQAERLAPDVVLLDVQLPGLDGFAVAERLAAQGEPPAVVLISSREAAAYGPRLSRAQARGFIPKRALSGKALASLVA